MYACKNKMYEVIYTLVTGKKLKFILFNFKFKIYFIIRNNIEYIKENIFNIEKDLKSIIKKMDENLEKNVKIIQTKIREYLYKPGGKFYQNAKENFYLLSYQKN